MGESRREVGEGGKQKVGQVIHWEQKTVLTIQYRVDKTAIRSSLIPLGSLSMPHRGNSRPVVHPRDSTGCKNTVCVSSSIAKWFAILDST